VEREQIVSVVRKHLAEVIGDLKPSDIDTTQSMKDLGATSLDIVEVVSLTRRELNVKVPRSELNKLTNMDGLVDLLHASMQQKVKAAQTS